MEANHALRRARLSRGWSQAVVAECIETSTKNISRWERGHTHPSPHFRAKLCELFAMDAFTLGLVNSDSISVVPSASPYPVPVFDAEIPRLTIATGKAIGRVDLLNQVLTALRDGGTHVFYGLPGVGKTTVAQLVSQHAITRDLFPDGSLWVSLGPNPTIHNELLRLARLLGMPKDEKAHDSVSLSEYVHRLLQERHLLIVIDDAWSVESVLPFLLGGPGVAHLLTTRLPEIAFSLPQAQPHFVPELDEEQSLAFLRILVPDLVTQSTQMVQQLLHYAGGLPLALTLLGHYLRTQTIGGRQRRMQAALERLSDVGLRLRVSAPIASTFQSSSLSWSLEYFIGMSDHYLSAASQQALRAISVLPARPGRFSEAAALAVSGQGIEVLDQLVDAGLIEGAGDGWYHLHQTIADYARMHRADGFPLQRLIHYGRQLCLFQNVETEYPVVLAALQAAMSLSQSQDLLDMLLHLFPFWRTRGYYEQASSWLSTVLDNDSISGDDTVQARLLAERAQFAVVQEKWELARQYAQAGLELSHLPRIRAQCLQTLGSIALQHGDRTRAKTFYEEGISLARTCADRERQSYLLNLLSGLIFQQGDYQQSECLNREGLDLARQEDNPELICSHLASLGIALQMQANYAEAEGYLREGVQLTRQLNYQLLQARMVMNLAVTVCGQGDWAQGEFLLQEGLLLARRMDDPRTVRRFLMNLGDVAIEQEDYDQADYYIREGLTQEAQTMDVNSRGMLLASLGVVLGKKGVKEEAYALFEECIGIANDLGNPLLLSSALHGWGDICLQNNQLDAAEERFQAALLAYRNGQPQPDMIAAAQFGLAKVAALRGRLEEEHELAEQCLRTFTEIHHRTAHEVQEWLATLRPSTPKTELSLHKRVYHKEQHAEKLVDNEEVQDQPLCPSCHNRDGVRKRGKNHSGSQRYHCSLCQRNFTLSAYRAPHPLAQVQVPELARQGLSARAIARQVGIHHTTVTRWLKKRSY